MSQHPSNLVKNRQPIEELVDKLNCIPPSEMYTVPTERQQPMVYVPWNWLMNELWELVLKIETPTTNPKSPPQ